MKYLRFLLLPFSWIYGSIMGIRYFLYKNELLKSFKASIPVISVGNISTGGTGKTPFAEYLLSYAHAKGLRPAYLSRGYGRKSKGCFKLNPQKVDVERYGDEASQVSMKFPQLEVWVSESRKEGILKIQEEGKADIIILDDAFQHLKVKRDFDIVMIDAQRLPYQDHVLPAGNLREFRFQLRRADQLIINKISDPDSIINIKQKLERYHKAISFCRPVFSNPKAVGEGGKLPNTLNGLPVVLFSGIGNNEYFEQMIVESGANILESFKFGDHYSYKKEDLAKISLSQRHWSEKLNEEVWVLTTEKDRMRLLGMKGGQFNSWIYFPIKLEWLGEKEAFLQKFEKYLDQVRLPE
ncbi:MAG: tetraacyldisaccharide 4'-kinase [Bacteroidia bacterium]|nr:tetraacyldisaccharide 4'-kinase [Bacteroidia bacterium]